MTLDEAYKITDQMTFSQNRKSTKKQREAKELIYNEVIHKQFNGEPPPWAEPDFMEGWK